MRAKSLTGPLFAAVAAAAALAYTPILLAVVAFALLAWWLIKPRNRPCPRCGRPVRVGELRCRCGYDFDA